MKAKCLLIAVLVLLFAGCVTTTTITDFSTVDPIGIVTVYSNGDIGWYGEEKESGGLLNNFASNLLNKEDNEEVSTLLSRADLLVDDADAELKRALSEVSSVSFIDQETLVSSSAYREVSGLPQGDLIPAEGYKVLSNLFQKDFAADIASETGVKGVTFVSFDFTKMMDTGVGRNGTMGAHVMMSVSMVDENGDTVFTRTYSASSDDNIAVVAGIYDPEDLLALYPELISKVCGEFAMDLNL